MKRFFFQFNEKDPTVEEVLCVLSGWVSVSVKHLYICGKWLQDRTSINTFLWVLDSLCSNSSIKLNDLSRFVGLPETEMKASSL